MRFPPLAPSPRSFVVEVAAPCSEDWEAMGEGAVRRCEKCSTDVHDLGALGPDAAERLMKRGACVRFARAPDGTVQFARAAVLAMAVACAPHPVPVADARTTAESPRCVAAPVAEGAASEVAVVPAGELHLQVVDDSGLPVPRTLVNLGAKGQPARQGETDAEGVLVFTGLPDGEWRWAAMHVGFSQQEGRVILGGGLGAALTVGIAPGDTDIVMGLVVLRSAAFDPTTVPAGITLPASTLERLPR